MIKILHKNDFNLKTFYHIFLPLFTLSGFAGLIYESLWTQYLKLLLGHSAYAQLLVLVTFMGGLSLGSWLAAKYSQSLPNLLKSYAIVEGLIAIAAFIFHFIFLETQCFLYEVLLPYLGNNFVITFSFWIVGALILLPQTILLGTTFPLMTGAMVRHIPESPGRITALLYFVNSIGGSVGILVAGFFLMEEFGLPGTSISAGLLNALIAVILWFMSKNYEILTDKNDKGNLEKGNLEHGVGIQRLSNLKNERYLSCVALLCCSFVTGLSSFFYEIGWIRMLSMVLGSATHSFEIMVSAFILGLALGGLAIYYWLPKMQSPLITLGYIQIIMGLAALISLPMYNQLFYYMEDILVTLQRTENNYLWFNILNHGLCLLLMFPTTFCAGMTLPLITHILLEKHYGEKSIGQVYSLNTFGAIIGAFIALYWVMPLFGLKVVIGSGALIDILLGYAILFWVFLEVRTTKSVFISFRDSSFVGVTILIIFYVTSILGTSELDVKKMASGVFRLNSYSSETVRANDFNVLFHRDGRTATVAVTKINNTLQVTTNGKTDASLSLEGPPTVDEIPQTLFAALPYSVYPSAKDIAVIGFGSGMTSSTLLDIPSYQQVDTIEIEPAMIEGGHYFGDRVTNVFQDKRSKIIIEDARSFFEAAHKYYDMIVSIPSNPWVSGVSSLFTVEFYKLIQKHLNKEGIFVQWVGLYELSPELAGSIFNAIKNTFRYYNVYYTLKKNVLIIASNRIIPDHPIANPFSIPSLKKALQHINIENLHDLKELYIGNETTLEAFFKTHNQINSDFYPVLDMGANRARFLLESVDMKQELNK